MFYENPSVGVVVLIKPEQYYFAYANTLMGSSGVSLN